MNNNTEYRRKGRDLTKGKILNIFLIGLIFSSILSLVTGIGASFNAVFSEDLSTVIDPGNPPVAQLFNLIAIALAGYVTFGLTKMFIGVSKNEKPEFEPILTAGVKEQPVNAPLLSFISSLFIGLWTLLFIIPGIVKSYSYALSSYLMVTDKTLGPVDAITQSRMLMNGKKMQLFMLDLGYFGWYVLSLFTLGVLLIWVTAWHQTARTLFFVDAVQPNNR